MAESESSRKVSLQCAPGALGNSEVQRLPKDVVFNEISMYELEAKLQAAQESLKLCRAKVLEDQNDQQKQQKLGMCRQQEPSEGCELQLCQWEKVPQEGHPGLHQRHNIAMCQKAGGKWQFPPDKSQGKDVHPHPGVRMHRGRGKQKSSEQQLSQKDEQLIQVCEPQREPLKRQNLPLQLDEEEVALLTAQIREKERKRLAKRLQVESRNLMTMNIGDLQTFDDVAILFTPKEWREWKEVEKLLQMDFVNGVLDLSSKSPEKDSEKRLDGQKARSVPAVRK